MEPLFSLYDPYNPMGSRILPVHELFHMSTCLSSRFVFGTRRNILPLLLVFGIGYKVHDSVALLHTMTLRSFHKMVVVYDFPSFLIFFHLNASMLPTHQNYTSLIAFPLLTLLTLTFFPLRGSLDAITKIK